MSWMEVKIYLHHQQIIILTVTTLKKMPTETSAQKTSRTNRGLLQHLNFCQRRNITSNGNQIITVNDGNNDNIINSNNSNGNDIPDKTECQEKCYWNLVAGSYY